MPPMTPQDAVQFIFPELTADWVQGIVSAGKLTHYTLGQVIMSSGEIPEHMYVVISGEVSLSGYIKIAEADMLVATVEPKGIFGLAEAFTHSASVLTGKAIQASDIFQITIEVLEAIALKDIYFRKALMQQTLTQQKLMNDAYMDGIEDAYATLKRKDLTQSTFYQIIATELNTPFEILKGYSNVLDVSLRNDQNLGEVVRGIIECLSQIEDTINKPLSVFRPIRVGTRSFSPSDGIEQVVGLFRNILTTRGLKLQLSNGLNQVSLRGNPTLFSRLMYEILSNAIKYSRDAGTIELTAISLNEESRPSVKVMVRDEGIGIPQPRLPLLFEPFMQFGELDIEQVSKTAFMGCGPGLGLVTAKKIVEVFGGKIWIESQEQSGTSVFIVLPLVQPDTSQRT